MMIKVSFQLQPMIFLHDDPTLTEIFDINNNTNKLICFVDAAHENDLHK